MSKILIEKIDRVQMPASNGRDPWTSVRVSFDGKTASVGAAAWNANWKAGDEVEVELYSRTDAKGREWLNIATPKMAEKVKENNELKEQLARIEEKLDRLLKGRGVL